MRNKQKLRKLKIFDVVQVEYDTIKHFAVFVDILCFLTEKGEKDAF